MYGEPPTPKELAERALTHEVSRKCMGWRIGTGLEWALASGLEVAPEEEGDEFHSRCLWLDKEDVWRYWVDEENCECGTPWSPATKLQDAWEAADYMQMTHVSFDMIDGQVECRVSRDTIMCKRSGSCPSEALSKALIAFTEV